MFKIMYAFWFLLPLVFFLFGSWAFLKPYFKVPGKENTKDYFKQGIYCLIAFGIAVFIDGREAFNSFISDFSSGVLDLELMRWLLYPIVLVVMVYIHHFFWGRKERAKRVVPKHRF